MSQFSRALYCSCLPRCSMLAAGIGSCWRSVAAAGVYRIENTQWPQLSPPVCLSTTNSSIFLLFAMPLFPLSPRPLIHFSTLCHPFHAGPHFHLALPLSPYNTPCRQALWIWCRPRIPLPVLELPRCVARIFDRSGAPSSPVEAGRRFPWVQQKSRKFQKMQFATSSRGVSLGWDPFSRLGCSMVL